MTAALTAKVVDDVVALGIEVAKVAVKDLGIGGDLKRVFTDSLTARQESLVTLEKARAEGEAGAWGRGCGLKRALRSPVPFVADPG
jgi:regulator of protease activity HflC (stomatin/prohibitin superfamily)